MYDFFWFSDFRRARIAPLLPIDVRSKKRVDDRPVPSGIVHTLRRGGRRAEEDALQPLRPLGRARYMGS